MDKLFEADVYYTTQKVALDYFQEENPFKTDFGESRTDNYAYLKYTDKVEHTGGGLFAGTYKWDRIQTVNDFIYAEDREENFFQKQKLDSKKQNKYAIIWMRKEK